MQCSPNGLIKKDATWHLLTKCGVKFQTGLLLCFLPVQETATVALNWLSVE